MIYMVKQLSLSTSSIPIAFYRWLIDNIYRRDIKPSHCIIQPRKIRLTRPWYFITLVRISPKLWSEVLYFLVDGIAGSAIIVIQTATSFRNLIMHTEIIRLCYVGVLRFFSRVVVVIEVTIMQLYSHICFDNVFTRGQVWPSGIVVSCVYLCVRLCVR